MTTTGRIFAAVTTENGIAPAPGLEREDRIAVFQDLDIHRQFPRVHLVLERGGTAQHLSLTWGQLDQLVSLAQEVKNELMLTQEIDNEGRLLRR